MREASGDSVNVLSRRLSAGYTGVFTLKKSQTKQNLCRFLH